MIFFYSSFKMIQKNPTIYTKSTKISCKDKKKEAIRNKSINNLHRIPFRCAEHTTQINARLLAKLLTVPLFSYISRRQCCSIVETVQTLQLTLLPLESKSKVNNIKLKVCVDFRTIKCARLFEFERGIDNNKSFHLIDLSLLGVIQYQTILLKQIFIKPICYINLTLKAKWVYI